LSAIDISPNPETAQGQTGHKGCEDRADGEDRVAEQEVQHAGPYHLVEEPAGAGQKAEDEHDATPSSDGGSGRDTRHNSIQVTASPGQSRVSTQTAIAHPARRSTHPGLEPGRMTIPEVGRSRRAGRLRAVSVASDPAGAS